jgi:hypothetical protein
MLLTQKYRERIQEALKTQNVDEIEKLIIAFQLQISRIRKEIQEIIDENERSSRKKIEEAHKR